MKRQPEADRPLDEAILPAATSELVDGMSSSDTARCRDLKYEGIDR